MATSPVRSQLLISSPETKLMRLLEALETLPASIKALVLIQRKHNCCVFLANNLLPPPPDTIIVSIFIL